MAIIYTYPIKLTPASSNDLIIISDSADSNNTKQIRVAQLPGGSSSGVTDVTGGENGGVTVVSSNGDGTGSITLSINGTSTTNLGGIRLGFVKDAANRNYPLLATANPDYKGYVSIDVMTGSSLASGGLPGLVPSSLAGDQAKFLRADGTWATATGVNVVANPAAGGDVALTALTVGNINYNVGTVTSVAVTSPLTTTVTTGGVANSPIISTGTIGIPAASSISDGYILKQDWNTFNNKQEDLVSGTTIKTIDNVSILGEGNITTSASGVTNITTNSGGGVSTGQAITLQSSQNGAVTIQAFSFGGNTNIGYVPSFTGEDSSNSFLRADGIWSNPSSSQVSSFTNTNGTFISAATVNSAATGAVTIGSIDLSATGIGASDKVKLTQFLRADNTWAIPNSNTGISSITRDNLVQGAVTFTGAGVSQTGNTFTFSGGGGAVDSVTTTNGTFINLTPASAATGAVTVTADLSATGAASSSTFLRGDNQWAAPSGSREVTNEGATLNTVPLFDATEAAGSEVGIGDSLMTESQGGAVGALIQQMAISGQNVRGPNSDCGVLKLINTDTTQNDSVVLSVCSANTFSEEPSVNPVFIAFKTNTEAVQTGGIKAISSTEPQFFTGSDYRLKQNIKDYKKGLYNISNLRPVTYQMKSHPEETLKGFIAHEVQEYIPSAVDGVKDGVDENGKDVVQTLSKGAFMTDVVSAIKELKNEIDSLRAEIKSLKK